MSGARDGDGLYTEDQIPCLLCGKEVGLDFDGVATWHFSALRAPWESPEWCRGSRTSLEVPT